MEDDKTDKIMKLKKKTSKIGKKLGTVDKDFVKFLLDCTEKAVIKDVTLFWENRKNLPIFIKCMVKESDKNSFDKNIITGENFVNQYSHKFVQFRSIHNAVMREFRESGFFSMESENQSFDPASLSQVANSRPINDGSTPIERRKIIEGVSQNGFRPLGRLDSSWIHDEEADSLASGISGEAAESVDTDVSGEETLATDASDEVVEETVATDVSGEETESLANDASDEEAESLATDASDEVEETVVGIRKIESPQLLKNSDQEG